MSKSENVAWIDGYFKGLTSLKSGKGLSCNAIVANLTKENLCESMCDFINEKYIDDELGLSFPKLILQEEKVEKDWYPLISKKIEYFFSELEIDSEAIKYEVFDILDLVIDGDSPKVYCFKAAMGDYQGEYFLVDIDNDEYIAISFMEQK